MQYTHLGVGAYSNVFQCGVRAYKPFDLVSAAVKTDQMVQFEAVKRALHMHCSLMALNVNVATIDLNESTVTAISMPYTPGMVSLDKHDEWSSPTRPQLLKLSEWLHATICELRRCDIVMLDFKMSNILIDPATDSFMLCDWDSLATMDDATAYVDDLSPSPIPRGTYDPFCSSHPAAYTAKALDYSMVFAAAVTVAVAYFGRHPHITVPLNVVDFEKRYRAMQTLLTTSLGVCPEWFVMPEGLIPEMEALHFFDQ